MTPARRSSLGPVAVVGCGRAGAALVRALRSCAGIEVRVWDRSRARARRFARTCGVRPAPDLAALLAGARLVIVAVSDDALDAVAGRLAREWPTAGGPTVALHLSGAQGSAALAPLQHPGARGRRALAAGVFHPVVSLVGARSASMLEGAFVTVSGDTRAVAAARRLARTLRMRAVPVSDAARPLVHLAATLAAGDLVALLGEAEELLGEAGVAAPRARAILGRLARGAVANYARTGAAGALTGPVARGDGATLAAHLQAIRRLGPRLRRAGEAHAVLAAAGAALLSRAGRLDARGLKRLGAVLATANLPTPRTPRTLLREREVRR